MPKHKKDPYFVRPLTGKQYRRDLKAATRDAFRSQQRELGGETRASREQSRRIDDYFKAYGKTVKSTTAASNSATENALNHLAGITAASSANDEALRQSLESEAQKDAALRGATYTPSATAADAASSRRNASDVFSGLIAAQGAAQSRYLGDKGRIGQGERIEQQRREAARRRSLNADKRTLAQAKGDFAKDYRSRARETERQFYLEQQQLAQTARGQKAQLKVAKQYGTNQAAHDAASSATQLKLQRRQAKAKKREQRRSQDIVDSQGGGKDHGSGYYSRGRLMGWLKSAPKGAYSSPAEAVAYLINRGAPPDIARKVVKNAQGGDSDHTSINAALHGA